MQKIELLEALVHAYKIADWLSVDLIEEQLASLPKEQSVTDDSHERLMEGRHYLMSLNADEITVEDALEAFGFGRNGLK